ncbi:protease modulator HflC [Megalodesulfovibrio gigas]|uniref:Putative HflC protein n=1 Tax=Megalodesulfovibrio gigas (strain ATCC 19364 / DSM 1382 / NCIMB 9332 / VKM B-1759) TaxID=1121448 RepID=T2GBX4_MEGG1|nr:protease modulator HflC [Megalodesulfovibrio gigas]AGW13422.1 putative HflC protein [Megalodesulfovibrio gigas DSM 1382 = ATCC 19364]
MKKLFILGLTAFVLIVVASMSLYTVSQVQTAIILEFGKPIGEAKAPGLHFKLPWRNVIWFDKRILDYDAKAREVLTSDKKTLLVDNYAKWRITNPLLFYQTVRTPAGALQRLDDVIYSEMREALGRYTMTEAVSTRRAAIMLEVSERSSRLIAEYGIEVVDVRIKRTDLPDQNLKSIYNRMSAERKRQAKQYRSEGEEEAAKIRSEADRERTVILAQARREAEILLGQGDAEAVRIYAEAYGADPSFYAFARSLEAYTNGLKTRTRMVLVPGSGFFQHLP